jgi:hypothetical protein
VPVSELIHPSALELHTRRAARSFCAAVLAVLLIGCANQAEEDDPVPTANEGREIIATALRFDVSARSGHASITFAGSSQQGASLEVGDLIIDSVSVPFAVTGRRMDLALPAAGAPGAVEIAFRYRLHDDFTGASPGGFTFLWPAHCSNLFPCHSAPSDGVSFTLAVSGLPAGQSAVYAGTIGPEAPAYQVAWAIGAYTEVPLGSTRAGTQVSVWHQAGEATAALEGTRLLVAAFDWFEQNIGPYRFGRQVGTVSVDWPGGSFGGMEHHPRWHIDRDSLADPVLNVHEAAHGWFGDGVRLRCWEDFVLSEGTATYLAARALEAVAPEVGAQVWRRYAAQLAVIPGATPVWPSTCGQVGVVEAGLATNAPYIRGAFFYKGVADKVGAEQLDHALAAFYTEHAGASATMDQMLQTLERVTGYDPRRCAEQWLRSRERPSPGPCP